MKCVFSSGSFLLGKWDRRDFLLKISLNFEDKAAFDFQ